MELWRKVWREGAAPHLSTPGLKALLAALERDDPRLIQGTTTKPQAIHRLSGGPVEAACLIGYPSAIDHGGFAYNPNLTIHQDRLGTDAIDPHVPCATVGQVTEDFCRICFKADTAIGEPGGCRHLLKWFDNTPREEMRRLLIEEVKRTLEERKDK